MNTITTVLGKDLVYSKCIISRCVSDSVSHMIDMYATTKFYSQRNTERKNAKNKKEFANLE